MDAESLEKVLQKSIFVEFEYFYVEQGTGTRSRTTGRAVFTKTSTVNYKWQVISSLEPICDVQTTGICDYGIIVEALEAKEIRLVEPTKAELVLYGEE